MTEPMEDILSISKRKAPDAGASPIVSESDATKKLKIDGSNLSPLSASTASPATPASAVSPTSISTSSSIASFSSPNCAKAAAAQNASPSSLVPSEAELLHMTVPELKNLCRLHGYKVMGAKHKLIDRLTGRDPAGRARGAAPPARTLKTISSTARKAMLAAGLTDHEIHAIDPAKLHKELTAQAKELYHMVDANWHDGYEEQGELVEQFRDSLQEPLDAILSICESAPSGSGSLRPALQRCHEALLAISDGYANLCSVPMRGTVEDNMSYSDAHLKLGEHSFTFPNEAASFVWRRLLCACVAEGMTEDELCRIIKDAVDYGCDVMAKDEVAVLKAPQVASASASADPAAAAEPTPSEVKEPSQASGAAERLREVVAGGSWRSLPTQRKYYAHKKVVDRRFFGGRKRSFFGGYKRRARSLFF